MDGKPRAALFQPVEARTIKWGIWGAIIGFSSMALLSLLGFTYVFVTLTNGTSSGITGNIDMSRLASVIIAGCGAVSGAIVGVVTAAARSIIEAINRVGQHPLPQMQETSTQDSNA